ncbi:immunoglobulin-like domain-containing protein [Cellulophaga lytica]|uniref:immunoglobulin-like domain-containing protein n=1 Tax=Cellulophaga lytica TaxID=979 RepID=UPI003CE54088
MPYSPNNPTFTPPTLTETYIPTSASDLESNPNKIAIITNSFDATGVTLASDQIIRPNGGVISGTNINLNDAYIEEVAQQAFSPSATFTAVYDKSRVYIELFGATSGDSTDDSDAIDATINNCEFATATLNGRYVKNKPSNYTRNGLFSCDMNGAEIEITSTANFNLTQVSTDYVFDFTNTSIEFYNGEFDGNDLYGRLFFLHGQKDVYFDNVHVHNLYCPSPIRAIAFRFSVSVDSDGFETSTFTDCIINNVHADGNGNYNDTDGVSKGWWYSLSDFSTSTNFSVYHSGNVVYNITGEDAEALYAIGGAGILHNGNFELDNEDYRNCTRRATKFCVSNVTLKNSYIEEMDDSLFVNSQQVGTMVDFFSTIQDEYIYNINVFNNTIKGKDNNDTHYQLVSFTDVDGVDFYNNNVEMFYVENYGGIRLGSGTSFYTGNLKNINIHDNTFKNCGVEMLTYYTPKDQIQITDNDFNYAYTSPNWGSNQAVLRTTRTSGVKGNINFKRNTIFINTGSSSSFFNGLIYSSGAEIINTIIESNTITYSNNSPGRPFGYLMGDFGNTNLINDNTIVGANGTDAIVIDGSDKSVVIQNSYGDNSTPITVEGVSPINRPIITLNGSTPVEITQGGTYTELGATWTDTEDGTGNATVGGDTVDTSIVGTYIVTYNHTDTDSNAAVQVTRTVNVVANNVPEPIPGVGNIGITPNVLYII